MKKVFFLAFCTLGVFISGCSSSSQLSADELFKKRQECVDSTQTIKEKYNNDNYQVSSVFYSIKRNSCIFRLSSYKLSITPTHILYDYLTDEEIINKDDICDEDDITSCTKQQKRFNQILQELKEE